MKACSAEPPANSLRHHGNVGLFLYDSGRDASADVAGLVEAWADCLAPDYGMIHSLCESERREATNPWRSDIDADGARGHAIWGFTPQLRHGLPTIYWRNFFGAPYIAAFGRSRLLSAPAHRAIEYPWGVEIQVTAEPPTEASYPSYREARDRLIEYLGQDLFIDPQHGIGKVACRLRTARLWADGSLTTCRTEPEKDRVPSRCQEAGRPRRPTEKRRNPGGLPIAGARVLAGARRQACLPTPEAPNWFSRSPVLPGIGAPGCLLSLILPGRPHIRYHRVAPGMPRPR